jgi:hypothetical protein
MSRSRVSWVMPAGSMSCGCTGALGSEADGHDPAPLGPEHRLHLVGKDRPGGGCPQVIGAVQVELAVLMDMTADHQRWRLAVQQVGQTAVGRRRPEPVGRRGGQFRAGRGQRLVRDQRDLLVLSAVAELLLEP